jgi:predicted DNA-binding transcriptional regulator AlpA
MSKMKLLTMKQVCEKVGLSRTQINRFRHDEEYAHVGFPKAAVVGFKVLFSDDEVNAWISKQLAKR